MRIEGKRIVITGAASGIGKCVLERLVRLKGVQIVAADRNPIHLDGHYPNVYPIQCDLSGEQGIDTLFEFALATMQGIDLFFANAGFAYYENIDGPDYKHIENIFRINVFAPIYICEKMKALNGDNDYKVVITSSAMGRLPLPGYSLYSATKASVLAFADVYRYELKSDKNVSCLCPVATKTSFFKTAGTGTPVPFPAQTPDAVAKSTIRGIEKDKRIIYPSLSFMMLLIIGSVLPFVKGMYVSHMNRVFQEWCRDQHAAIQSKSQAGR